ncbi:peptide ABC transporter substrate-binding protein [Virgibacillus halodenitrificans]|uniref:peptide ABC transporter substrate-binding protein n=1 Tax=Virgibacillus halodenitrificans TaxID=1482 RepID=UPI0024C0BE43|nr:peptide ABC transporter substrate-binding protein [Virgibacillus halodenitrificans]WHX26534.1 peptide ABC transporter substrate-binding protein [Virgibacillus halodenitrificans]
MHRLLKTFFVFIVLISIGVIGVACDNSTNTSEDGDKTSKDNKQVVNLTKSEQITTMDLTLANDQVSNQFLSMTTEGLYRLDEKGEKVPGIATKSEVSDDGLKWTFHLRDNAEWENGDPVTAHDFVYAWQRAINPDTGSEYGPYLMNGVVKNAKSISGGKKKVSALGIEAKDDHTLVATLEKPIPYFESLISFGIFNWPLNEKFVEKSGDNYGTSSEYLLSNGPYKLKEWESTSDSWKLEKNASYWDAEEVSIEEFNYNVAKDNQLIVDLYEKGEIDRAELSSDLVDQFQSREDFDTTPEASVFYLKMNQQRTKALGNRNIRKAISRAFDKEALVNNILNNGSIAANGLVPKKFSTHPESGKDFREINGDLVSYDAEKAKKLWEKGLQEIGKETVELEYLSGDSGDSKFISEYMANQLEKNLPGLSITIKRVPLEQLTTLDKSMDYDLQFTGWAPDYQDPFTFLGMWITDENTNKMGYSVEKYDEILSKTQNELATKPVERYEALLEAEEILFDTAAVAPVYQTASAKLISPKLNGVITNAVGPEYEYKWAEIGSSE